MVSSSSSYHHHHQRRLEPESALQRSNLVPRPIRRESCRRAGLRAAIQSTIPGRCRLVRDFRVRVTFWRRFVAMPGPVSLTCISIVTLLLQAEARAKWRCWRAPCRGRRCLVSSNIHAWQCITFQNGRFGLCIRNDRHFQMSSRPLLCEFDGIG
jgi:hypothetical protein